MSRFATAKNAKDQPQIVFGGRVTLAAGQAIVPIIPNLLQTGDLIFGQLRSNNATTDPVLCTFFQGAITFGTADATDTRDVDFIVIRPY